MNGVRVSIVMVSDKRSPSVGRVQRSFLSDGSELKRTFIAHIFVIDK